MNQGYWASDGGSGGVAPEQLGPPAVQPFSLSGAIAEWNFSQRVVGTGVLCFRHGFFLRHYRVTVIRAVKNPRALKG